MLYKVRIRPIRLGLLAFMVIFATYVTLALKRRTAPHILQPGIYREHNIGPSEHLLLPDKVPEFCQAHNFQIYGDHPKRRVYDLFMLSTELDWLEIRLHTLSPFVDYFIIVESNTTFTGLAKPLHLAEHWDDYAAFHQKIIYRVVEDPGPSVGSRTWDHEDYMRNAMLHLVFPTLSGTSQEARHGDVLVVGDVDEIPKPETLAVLRMCDFPLRLTLRSHFYYYSFQWLHRGEQWAHPQATVYHGLDATISPKDLRNGEGSQGWFFLGHLKTWLDQADMWNAAWHCSSCFATVKEMQTKMNSFSHAGWNTAENREVKTIVQRVRNGWDLFGRPAEVYDRVRDNTDIPAYVAWHGERLGYLLDRDGENAGFADVPLEERGSTGINATG